MNSVYPTIKQSMGAVGILIGCMIVAAPVLFLEDLIGKEPTFLLYYLLAMGIGFAAIRKAGGGNIRPSFQFEVEDKSLIPFVVVGTLSLTIGVVLPLVSLIPIPDVFKRVFLELSKQDGFFSFLSIVVAAPVLEELIFRGIILDGFLKRYSPIKGILFSSFLFGFIHLNPWQFLGAGTLGIFMGWIYYRTRSVTLTILIHFTNNLAAFISGQFHEMTMENMDDSMIETYGGVMPFVIITGTALLVLAGCIIYLNQKMGDDPLSRFADPIKDPAPNLPAETPSAMRQENTDGDAKAS